MSASQKRDYRATVIFNTQGYTEPVETLYASFKDALTELGAEVGETVEKGRHDFVYITEKSHTGDVYAEFPFAAEATLPANLQERFRLEKTVKRIIVQHA